MVSISLIAKVVAVSQNPTGISTPDEGTEDDKTPGVEETKARAPGVKPEKPSINPADHTSASPSTTALTTPSALSCVDTSVF